MFPVLTRPLGFKNAILEVVCPIVVPIVLRTSDRLSLLVAPRPFGNCADETEWLGFDEGAFDRTRSAQDLGAAGGETALEVASDAAGEGSLDSGRAGTDDFRSASLVETDPNSDTRDVVEITESRWAFLGVVGLFGKMGTAGIMGSTTRLLGWVGVC